MSILWEHVETPLEGVGWPDMGRSAVWRWWFRRTWGRLNDAGWFDADGRCTHALSGADGPRLTLFALRWLVEDLCSKADEWPGACEPDWDDWLGAIRLDQPQAIQCAQTMAGWPEIESTLAEESGLDDAGDDDELASSREEIEEAKPVQAVLILAAAIRP